MRALFVMTMILFGVLVAYKVDVSSRAVAAESDFRGYEKGWAAGWDAGWKQVKGEYSTPPIAPVAPVAKGEANYKSGFAAGVVAGAAEASKRTNRK